MPRASRRRQIERSIRDPFLEDRVANRRALQAQAEATPAPAAPAEQPLSQLAETPAADPTPAPIEVGPSHEAPADQSYSPELLDRARLLRCPPELLIPASDAQKRAVRGKPSFASIMRREAERKQWLTGWGWPMRHLPPPPRK